MRRGRKIYAMRGIRLLIVLGVTFVAGVVACDHSVQERELAFCDTFCHCTAAPTDLGQETCVTDCVGSAQGGVSDQISDECLTCITGHADKCTTVELDCEPVCNFSGSGSNPPPPPPVIVDGGI